MQSSLLLYNKRNENTKKKVKQRGNVKVSFLFDFGKIIAC
jgi:hypothetical protein